ncbi:MAG: dTDP-4-dehydrorhamnose 3,5-epimerase family protein [candidate division Zixibacteria bacterium]|nr:dTDP-4-dehydrorhamnose 3,5-epimerase family protein [candidate division Zixibacteria bacterium]
MIDGVRTKKLVTHVDDRGWLFEILRNDDDLFIAFGQVYLTAVYSGVVKAWHCHALQTDNFTVVSGMARLVLADLRENSPTRGEINEFHIGDQNRMLVRIPPGVYHGLKGIGPGAALALNCPTEPYNPERPDEIRLPYTCDEIPYDWDVRHG